MSSDGEIAGVLLSSFIIAFCRTVMRMNELLVLPVQVIFPHIFPGPMLLSAVLILLVIRKKRLINYILVEKRGSNPSLI